MVSATTIFYVIYFIYLFSLLIDWEFIINSEYAILGILLILFTLIFATCILGTLNIEGYQVFGLTGTYVAILLVGLLLTFGLMLYYQYNTTNKHKTTIMTKLARKDLIPLSYQYGRDSQEIGMRLRVPDNRIIPRNESITLQEIWERLMSHNHNHMSNKSIVNKLLKEILSTDINETSSVSHDLLWYLCISEDPFRTGLTKKEISYLMKCNNSELEELLGLNNTTDTEDLFLDNHEQRINAGERRVIRNNHNLIMNVLARDRASLLFTILSGQIIPPITPIRNHDEIIGYNPSIIYNLAFIHNKMIDHNNGTYSLHGPYTYLLMKEPSAIEGIITNIEGEDYTTLINRLGIGPINNFDLMTNDEKLLFLQGELSLYHNVFNRDSGFEQPPDLINLNRDEIMNILSYYTNVELIQAYEPRGKWTSRTELIRLITDDVMNGPKWSIHSVLNCNNDDTLNILAAERHGDMDKHDLEDPTLSYGIHKNYRCYQASELEGSFTDYDGVFLFRVPDWTHNSEDPITRAPLIREFPLDSIKQLKELLHEYTNIAILRELYNKIETGLNLMKSATMQTRQLKLQLENFTFEQRRIAELYLAWMFNYSMWMRFWKGPGSPWPLTKINIRRESERNREQRSSPEERDEYIFIQEGVRTAIIEMYEKDPDLKNWIESLPTIYYDFETKEASCATHTIKSILDQIAIGDYCMGFGSDTILKTAYYYITSLLEHTQGHRFDEFIERMFPQLQDLEYTSVTNQLNSVNTPGLRLQVLNNRLHILHQPIPKQPPFNPDNYQNNVHVD